MTRTERGAYERGQGPVQTSLKINLMEVGLVPFCRSTSCLTAALQSNRRSGKAFFFPSASPGKSVAFRAALPGVPSPWLAVTGPRTQPWGSKETGDETADFHCSTPSKKTEHHPPGADLSHQSICRCALSSEPIKLQLLHPKKLSTAVYDKGSSTKNEKSVIIYSCSFKLTSIWSVQTFGVT